MTAVDKKYSELDELTADEFAQIQKAEHDRKWAAARTRASRKLKDEQRLRDRRDPAFCRSEAERRGLRLVSAVWGNHPGDPALVFANDSQWLYDDRGAHLIDATGEAVFVHGPCVALGARRYAIQAGGKWKTVELAQPVDRVQHKVQHDLEQLARAGMAIGSGELLRERSADGEVRVNVAVVALEQIFGAGPNGEIVCRTPAIRSLFDYAPDNRANLR